MDTEKIRMLLRAVELRSLSRAAGEYGYSSSAFSHMADSLENKIGIKILKRTHTGVELCENCREIPELLRDIIRAEDKLYTNVSALRENSKEIKIGTYSSISKNILPKLLKGFLKKYPETGVNIIVGDVVSDWLESGKADIVLSDNDFGSRFCNRLLFVDRYVAVLRKGESVSDTVSKEDLYKYPFILPLDRAITSCFDMSRFKDVIRVNSSDDTLIVQMIKEGIGITVLPLLSVTAHKDEINISSLSFDINRSIFLSYSENSKKPGAIKKLASYIENEIIY